MADEHRMSVDDRRNRNVSTTYKHIRPYVQNKLVLDIGCVAHDSSKEKSNEWLHGLIREDANEVLGIDLLEDEINKLKDKGYNVKQGDAQSLELEKKYDVVVLGEIIEHLTNFEGLIRSIDNNLKKDGVVIFTTPNAVAIHWTILRLFNIRFVNEEHTCWFDSQTLTQLINRYGFRTKDIKYVGDCSLKISDPLQTLGVLVEYILPDRIGKSTLILVAERSNKCIKHYDE